jgi:DNA-binding transcriptional LysR family regulator
MELRHMKAFIAVAEELNFRRAAERLHMAQPPLSQQIKRLERDVGAILLNRTTRHVSLTPAGEAFLKEARRAVQAADDAPRAARDAAAGRTGVIRLGFSGPSSYEVLVHTTRMYRERRPNVRLEVVAPVFGGELIAQLAREEVDAGLVWLPIQGTDILLHEVIRYPIDAALPIDHPLADRTEVELDELRDQPLIAFPRDSGSVLLAQIHSAFVEHGYTPNIVQAAPDTHTVLSLVGAGIGVSFVPTSAAHMKLPGVVLVRVTDMPAIPLALAWREGSENSALQPLVGLLDDLSAAIPTPERGLVAS